uniref:DUF7642 domain-containing protein n=1 Tax=Ananas comosus var. bracteatus TaxID=296719 RepID=A0A6V7NGD8_ANACO|nr:unnamed protein product [Ananas comosus var. bracteatus]
MASADEAVDIDVLERRLLSDSVSNEYNETDDDTVLYHGSFEEMEDKFVKYQTAQWILYSILLILAWGIGILMLLYLPFRIYVCRKDFRSRKLYLTSNAIVYKVTKPVAFPCFGVLKKEKHVILPSVADVVVEQGYLQSLFGIYSIRIENTGVRRPASDDVKIHGIAHPRDFRQAVLTRLSSMKSECFSRQASINEDLRITAPGSLPSASVPPPGELILEKLEVVESSVKRVQKLIEKKAQPSEL